VQNLLNGIKFAIFYLNWYLSLFLNDRMELQVQEVATIRENLGLNFCLTALGPDGLRPGCLEVADECQGQQVIFPYVFLYSVITIHFQTDVIKLYLLIAHHSFA
jgi:hypothetical protein